MNYKKLKFCNEKEREKMKKGKAILISIWESAFWGR